MRLGDGLLDVSSGCDAALATSKLQGGYFRARVSVCHACSTTKLALHHRPTRAAYS